MPNNFFKLLTQNLDARLRNSVPRKIRNGYDELAEPIFYSKEIESYMKQLMIGSEEWKSAKIVVLGHGGVGKTTFINAFGAIADHKTAKVIPHL